MPLPLLQVYIKPNKVVYLPTTFVEEEFDVARLPLDCELLVEAEGELAQETFEVGRGQGCMRCASAIGAVRKAFRRRIR